MKYQTTTSDIRKINGIVSIYNPKHPKYKEVKVIIDDPINDPGYINKRITPIDLGMNKNNKYNTRDYIIYTEMPEIGSIKCISKQHDEIYYSEWGLTDIKKAYKHFNTMEQRIKINVYWRPYLKPTKMEMI